MSYFDSAFIVKFYLDEPESNAIRLLAESIGEVHCVQLGRLEAASAFHRKWREGAFTDVAFREVSGQLADDCAAGLWQWLPVTAALVEAASAAIRRLPRTLFLRSADALHLTCAREHGFEEIYSNDRNVLAAARHFKLKGVDAAAR
ncbi:MAG TPA: type II toxin-antitoxin system VapC family toxin [Burkholderiales bacterium]|nr:type II toxin-antitoxin system VapC family toxin [Burkholderiales bacterium]